jgi:hypothetical protein
VSALVAVCFTLMGRFSATAAADNGVANLVLKAKALAAAVEVLA